MAEIVPFRAFHYGRETLSRLNRVVCPPYDVIPADEHKRLLARHADNFVRVELPAGPPARRYAAAAGAWKRWLKRGVIERDIARSIYVYQVEFKSERNGRPMSRRGFFAALRLRPWGEGIYPHEKTLPTPKADRLKLFKAVRVQTSPIQCLYDDSSGRSDSLLERIARTEPWIDWKDAAGVRHRLWRLGESEILSSLQKILSRAVVMIADGHHRYETARAFSAWARGKWGASSPASRYVMALFSPSDDAGLEILPTHRAVGWDKRRFVKLKDWGAAKPASGWRALQARLEKRPSDLVGVFKDGKFYEYRLTKLPPQMKDTPFERLAVARLHAGPLDGLGKEDFFFTRKPEEAAAWAKRSRGWAFFLAPNSVQDVVRVATSGRVMPPKSTYFYPKIPSGILSYPLFGDL